MTMNLNELVRGGTICLSKAGLAISSNTAKAKILAPNGAGVDFAINGVLYHVAEAADLVVFTAATQAALTTCLYLVSIDSANTITVTKGTEVLDTAIAAGAVIRWPTPPVNTCPIGAIKVSSGAGVFTAGTTALTGGTVTVTYYDLLTVPVAPLTS
jgi:hypothetical protein